jgi:hypothetical protein
MMSVHHTRGRMLVRAQMTAVLAGLAFGAATSALNHVSALSLPAAVIGSGAGWMLAGVTVAAVVARWCPTHLLGRSVMAAAFYLGACFAYYVCDWGFALPVEMRLRDDVSAGRIPPPAGASLGFDVSEWLFWSLVSIPAAVGATLLVAALHGVRREGAQNSEHSRGSARCSRY